MIDAIGAKVGKTVGAMSGSAGLVNPNLITEYKHAQVPQARALGATLGMALDEDLVALIDPRAASNAGLVLIHLTVKADKHAAEILAAIQAMLQENMDHPVRGAPQDRPGDRVQRRRQLLRQPDCNF